MGDTYYKVEKDNKINDESIVLKIIEDGVGLEMDFLPNTNNHYKSIISESTVVHYYPNEQSQIEVEISRSKIER